MTRRSDRVAESLRIELAEILQREVRDPRVALATVSRVDLSGDLRHAVINISALGNDDERSGAVTALENAAGFVRRQLARRLRMRAVPELVFRLDRGIEHSQHISDLLESLQHDDDGS